MGEARQRGSGDGRLLEDVARLEWWRGELREAGTVRRRVEYHRYREERVTCRSVERPNQLSSTIR